MKTDKFARENDKVCNINFTNRGNNNHFLLGMKRNSENQISFNHNNYHQNQNKHSIDKLNFLQGGEKLLKLLKNGNEEVIPKKLEFKLSHILQGENTVIPLKEETSGNTSTAGNTSDEFNQKTQSKSTSTQKKEFYDDDSIDSLLYWKKQERIGSGLNNLGNTCFLNSVLQSLIYTPPLRNYLVNSNHLKTCKVKGICFLCEFGKLINFIWSSKTPSITPRNIIQNLNLIAKSLRIGRQEDAHEFLLYLLDSFEKSAKQYKMSSWSNFISKSPSEEIDDNLIQKIFGGKLVSSVTCLKCRKVSRKFDNFLDVSLQIFNSENIEKCFETFCKSESLSGNNKFFCENCKAKNDSVKKMSFEKLPRILTLHLKRFDNFQRKIKKFVKYDNHLNLTRFTQQGGNKHDSNGTSHNQTEYKYRLFSVLVHDGFSINCGHYYCYVKNSDGFWYQMNDSWVSRVSEKSILQQTPYLLFYERVMEKKSEKFEMKPERIENIRPVENKKPEVKELKEVNQIKIDEMLRNITSTKTEPILPLKEDVKIEIKEKEEPLVEVVDDQVEYDYLNIELPFSFVSRKRQKMKQLLKNRKCMTTTENDNNLTLPISIPISASIDNDSIESDSKSEKLDHPIISSDSIKTPLNVIVNDASKFNSLNENHKTIHNRNLINFYGANNIDLWDTEDDSDLLREQIKFIKTVPEFKENKVAEKDEYDLKYDEGKLKKIKLKKEDHRRYNVFQRVHNNLAWNENK